MLPSTQPEKCTCGATLAENARFCHRCGRPVHEMSTAELEELFPTPPPPPPVIVLPPPPMPIGFSNPVALRVAIMMSLAITMMELMPYLVYLSFLWWMLAGWAAVWLYRRLTGIEVTVSAGARLGFLTGLFTFIGMTLLFALMMASTDVRDALNQQMLKDPRTADILKNPTMLGSVMIMALVMFFARKLYSPYFPKHTKSTPQNPSFRLLNLRSGSHNSLLKAKGKPKNNYSSPSTLNEERKPATPEKPRTGGPQTEAGKAISSQNAMTYGLFATRDFLRPGEQSDLRRICRLPRSDLLAPIGLLELNLADEIRRAMWRLQRCAQIEASCAPPRHRSSEDPMQQQETARLQVSVDRARNQAHRLLHKCTTELRKLQTERHYRNETIEAGTDLSEFGLADYRVIRKGLDQKFRADYHREKFTGMSEIDALLSYPSSARRVRFVKRKTQRRIATELPL